MFHKFLVRVSTDHLSASKGVGYLLLATLTPGRTGWCLVGGSHEVSEIRANHKLSASAARNMNDASGDSHCHFNCDTNCVQPPRNIVDVVVLPGTYTTGLGCLQLPPPLPQQQEQQQQRPLLSVVHRSDRLTLDGDVARRDCN